MQMPLSLSAPVTLYPHQGSFVLDLGKTVAAYDEVIACAATGSGKTKMFIAIARRAIAKGKTVLVITESKKIYGQISQELESIDINAGVENFYIRKNIVYLAMSQTLAKRTKMIDNFRFFGKELLVIIDEAHIGTMTNVLLQLQGTLKLGFTASPDWRSAKHLPLIYKALVVGPQPEELVQMGYLAPYRHFGRVAANMDALKIVNGDFSEESQEFVFESAAVYDSLVEDLQTMKFKKCMVFTASIKHCNDVYEMLRDRGFPVTLVHSQKKGYSLTEKQSDYNLSQFMYGDKHICVSVGSLTKGYDFPAIDLVVLFRKTTSLPLYLQMIGRASRKADGKTHFTVLDYGRNLETHWGWDYAHDWQKMWQPSKKKKKSAEAVAPIKLCPSCQFMCGASVMTCPNCGYAFVKPPPTPQETQLIEYTEKYTIMVGKKISELTPAELANYAKLKNKKSYAMRVARAQDQTDPKAGWLEAFGQEMGYKPGWPLVQRQNYEADRDAAGNEIKIEYYDFVLR
jgi:superfamily II DNA or RNA helicase